jgi:ribosomal-protein-alanine N-acetyltransferase
LLKEALQNLTAQGVAEVFLEVQTGNEPAERLYASFGAVQVGLRPGYYSLPGGGRADARVLRLLPVL